MLSLSADSTSGGGGGGRRCRPIQPVRGGGGGSCRCQKEIDPSDPPLATGLSEGVPRDGPNTRVRRAAKRLRA